MYKGFLTLLTFALFSQAGAAGTLVYGAPGEPVNLNAGNGGDSPSLQGDAQIYDRLIDFKPGTAELVPALATSWKRNAAATVWTLVEAWSAALATAVGATFATTETTTCAESCAPRSSDIRTR